MKFNTSLTAELDEAFEALINGLPAQEGSRFMQIELPKCCRFSSKEFLRRNVPGSILGDTFDAFLAAEVFEERVPDIVLRDRAIKVNKDFHGSQI
jgi:hypothetical protein